MCAVAASQRNMLNPWLINHSKMPSIRVPAMNTHNVSGPGERGMQPIFRSPLSWAQFHFRQVKGSGKSRWLDRPTRDLIECSDTVDSFFGNSIDKNESLQTSLESLSVQQRCVSDGHDICCSSLFHSKHRLQLHHFPGSFFRFAGKTCQTRRVQKSKCKSFHELSARWITVERCPSVTLISTTGIYIYMKMSQVIILILVICTDCESQSEILDNKRENVKKFVEKFPNGHLVVVFTGLRRSRKPRWVPLLPRHPLRLLLSRQGPRSQRRRSWAQMMRSRRTPQTTAKVRSIHTEVIGPKSLSILYISHRPQRCRICTILLLSAFARLPLSWRASLQCHLSHQ